MELRGGVEDGNAFLPIRYQAAGYTESCDDLPRQILGYLVTTLTRRVLRRKSVKLMPGAEIKGASLRKSVARAWLRELIALQPEYYSQKLEQRARNAWERFIFLLKYYLQAMRLGFQATIFCARAKIASKATTPAVAIVVMVRIEMAFPTIVQSDLIASPQREGSYERVFIRLKPSFSVLWTLAKVGRAPCLSRRCSRAVKIS